MADKATELTDVRELSHLVQYTAISPDGVETFGVATVTGTAHEIPYAQLAAIPGFLEGDVLREHDGAPRPILRGPGTDTPGHVGWCVEHEHTGDGRALCWGEMTRIGAATLALYRGSDKPAVVSFDMDTARDGEELTPGQARERAAQLRQIAAELDALAAQAEAGSAVSA